MIIYTHKCLSCTNKPLWKKVKLFAAQHELPIEERRVSMKDSWKKEADNYGVELPFAVQGKVALNLNEELEKLL